MRVNTARVIKAWREGRRDRREASVWTDGVSIYSYGTAILAPLCDGLAFNAEKYSRTTSAHQSAIRWSIGTAIAREVRGLPLGASPEALVSEAEAGDL